jgi:hypothetical protein
MSWRTDADVLSMSCPGDACAPDVGCSADAAALSTNCRADVDALSRSCRGAVDALVVSGCADAGWLGVSGLAAAAKGLLELTGVEVFRETATGDAIRFDATSEDSWTSDRLGKEGCAVSSLATSDSVVPAWVA